MYFIYHMTYDDHSVLAASGVEKQAICRSGDGDGGGGCTDAYSTATRHTRVEESSEGPRCCLLASRAPLGPCQHGRLQGIGC